MIRPSIIHLFCVTLRAMLVLVAVCMLLAWKTHQVRQQRKTLARVRELGGVVVYDYQYNHVSTKPIIQSDARPPGPRWLRDLIGIDYFMPPHFVYLQTTNVTDKEVGELQDALPDCKIVRRLSFKLLGELFDLNIVENDDDAPQPDGDPPKDKDVPDIDLCLCCQKAVMISVHEFPRPTVDEIMHMSLDEITQPRLPFM